MINYKEYKGFQDPSRDRKELLDVRGAFRTESLFRESIQTQSRRAGYDPFYSLRDYEHKGFVSAYQIYMNSIDERDAALKLVGSMLHWRKLLKLRWFMNGRVNTGFEGISQWREDMSQRDATEAKRVILEQCSDNNVTAARTLNDIVKNKKNDIHGKSKKSPEDKREEAELLSIVDKFKK